MRYLRSAPFVFWLVAAVILSVLVVGSIVIGDAKTVAAPNEARAVIEHDLTRDVLNTRALIPELLATQAPSKESTERATQLEAMAQGYAMKYRNVGRQGYWAKPAQTASRQFSRLARHAGQLAKATSAANAQGEMNQILGDEDVLSALSGAPADPALEALIAGRDVPVVNGYSTPRDQLKKPDSPPPTTPTTVAASKLPTPNLADYFQR